MSVSANLPAPFDTMVSWILLEHVADADYYLAIVCGLLIILAIVQLRAFARPPPVPLKKLPRRPALQILFKPDDDTKSTPGETPSSASPKTGIVKSVKDTIFRASRSQASTGPETDGSEASLDNESSSQKEPVVETTAAETPLLHSHDLPDSFAPLLSSSQMEILHHQLTADLIHAVDVKGAVRVRQGRHEIPLDKDRSRPQLLLDVPKGGCRVTAVAGVGSDGLTAEQDLDVSRPTSSRSKPMVKHAGLVLDPPLPLANVAPTLIHFPTLFEDYSVPFLRSIQIVRFAMDLLISFSSFLEKVLWIIESKCQIHLSNVRMKPLYKGSSGKDNDPEWRLTLAFSGHVLLFNWIPIPFISVILPTFIIPHPHALLEHLLTAQPLASAKLKRENIAEKRIALAGLNILEGWDLDLKAVATPPALGVDVTLPGGVAVALEMMHGRDVGTRRHENAAAAESMAQQDDEAASVKSNSMSSWTTYPESIKSRPRRNSLTSPSATGSMPMFDANELVPWFLETSMKGTVSHQKMSVHIMKFAARHDDKDAAIPRKSKFTTSGSLAVWKADAAAMQASKYYEGFEKRKSASYGHLMALASSTDSPSVLAILLSLDESAAAAMSSRAQRMLRMLQFDYAFDVWDDTQVDAVSLSVGASHPMLSGGTMVTTILESIYAFGSMTAREGAILDPSEKARKRNILRHLPAVDFTFGIQNIFIPPESQSYSDDGQNMCIPEMEQGRMKIRILGGSEERSKSPENKHQHDSALAPVAKGIKFVTDFSVGSLTLNSESMANEFPELEIYEGTKLISLISGGFTGRISSHLRPQTLSQLLTTTGPNIFNPLEAYEIDFGRSSLSFKIKEWSATLGHRRVIMPTESTFVVKVVESILDMSMEGKTQCELSWDLQGLSPILQATAVGESPANVSHENKRQVSLLIAPLRQGRLNFHLSAVGGICITKAKTSREDREGLYDWKFFNAIVSPDQGSAQRLLDVVHDKRTMEKLLAVTDLINADLHKILRYVLTQVWRAKDIFDQEGVSDPGHVIPGHKMARLLSLFLCGDDSQVDAIVPIIQRITAGEGLDVVNVKELLREHVTHYDEWAPEIDRGIRWAALMFGPNVPPAPVVENNVPPLCEVPHYAARFVEIPSARELYNHIHEKPQLPLEPNFSNLVSRVAPYLSFRQVEYFLQARSSTDWQPSDLRRLRYVYSVKKKVMDISESYGGLSFLPQSFLVSVFLGEATRASLRASRGGNKKASWPISKNTSTLSGLRRRRMSGEMKNKVLEHIAETANDDFVLTPAGRVASQSHFVDDQIDFPNNMVLELEAPSSLRPMDDIADEQYELGDSLLGPQDVAILLQAGLTSAMKGSTVVQLNQRMLLDLMTSQPKSFAVAVLAEIGTPGGQGSTRSLTSALMALLELDQSSFTPGNRLDMHALLESWLPGFKVPRREDYLAGGRWARQSFYEAIYGVAKNILEDAQCYMALKSHIQRDRHHTEDDPIPQPKELTKRLSYTQLDQLAKMPSAAPTKLNEAIRIAKEKIDEADTKGIHIRDQLLQDERRAKSSGEYEVAVESYRQAFDACVRVLELDKCAFQSTWFREFYKRNYDALMVKSIYDNIIEDVDNVRDWMNALRRGSSARHSAADGSAEEEANGSTTPMTPQKAGESRFDSSLHVVQQNDHLGIHDNLFSNPEKSSEQVLIDAIIDAIFYKEDDRRRIRSDPLVRLLISNPPGSYNFAIVTAMGVITDGKSGLELQAAFERLTEQRDVVVVRADTGTARSFEYNAAKIEEAIASVTEMKRPYGLLGYSQGCANALTAESLLLSGSPVQQQSLVDPHAGLVCRQLLFSAANGSMHGPAVDFKIQRGIVMVEEFFKYQQGYFSRAFTSGVLELINQVMDSAPFQKFLGGAQSMLHDGTRAFWREAQHLSHVPTCTMRGVLEDHTLPESLEMTANLLTKQSGSALHDSQVHVYDAVGHPVYTMNRNGRIMRNCDVGEGAIQRTHHWSPLSDEVEFVRTQRDVERATFECAKDRHVFPWVDLNVRFGFIRYATEEYPPRSPTRSEDSSDWISCGTPNNLKDAANLMTTIDANT